MLFGYFIEITQFQLHRLSLIISMMQNLKRSRCGKDSMSYINVTVPGTDVNFDLITMFWRLVRRRLDLTGLLTNSKFDNCLFNFVINSKSSS